MHPNLRASSLLFLASLSGCLDQDPSIEQVEGDQALSGPSQLTPQERSLRHAGAGELGGFILASTVADPDFPFSLVTASIYEGDACPFTRVSTGDGGVCRIYGPCAATSAAREATDVGRIRVTGGAARVVLTPNAAHRYSVVNKDLALFLGGETLQFAADGGEEDGFVQTLQAPAPARFRTPAWVNDFTDVSVLRSRNLPFTWTSPVVPGQRQAFMDIVIDSGDNSIECRFPALNQRGTIPASVLRTLPVGSGYVITTVRAEKVATSGEQLKVIAQNDGPQGEITLR